MYSTLFFMLCVVTVHAGFIEVPTSGYLHFSCGSGVSFLGSIDGSTGWQTHTAAGGTFNNKYTMLSTDPPYLFQKPDGSSFPFKVATSSDLLVPNGVPESSHKIVLSTNILPTIGGRMYVTTEYATGSPYDEDKYEITRLVNSYDVSYYQVSGSIGTLIHKNSIPFDNGATSLKMAIVTDPMTTTIFFCQNRCENTIVHPRQANAQARRFNKGSFSTLYYDSMTTEDKTLLPDGRSARVIMAIHNRPGGIALPDGRFFSAGRYSYFGSETDLCSTGLINATVLATNLNNPLQRGGYRIGSCTNNPRSYFDYGSDPKKIGICTSGRCIALHNGMTLPSTFLMSCTNFTADLPASLSLEGGVGSVTYSSPEHNSFECNQTGCFTPSLAYQLVSQWTLRIAAIPYYSSLKVPTLQGIPDCEQFVCSGSCTGPLQGACDGDIELRAAVTDAIKSVVNSYGYYTTMVSRLAAAHKSQSRRKRATNYGNGIYSNGGWAILPNEHQLFKYVAGMSGQMQGVKDAVNVVAQKVNEVISNDRQQSAAINNLQQSYNTLTESVNSQMAKYSQALNQVSLDMNALHGQLKDNVELTQSLSGQIVELSQTVSVGFSMVHNDIAKFREEAADAITELKLVLVEHSQAQQGTTKAIKLNRAYSSVMAKLISLTNAISTATDHMSSCHSSLLVSSIGGCLLADNFLIEHPTYAGADNLYSFIVDQQNSQLILAYIAPKIYGDMTLTGFTPPPVKYENTLYWLDYQTMMYNGPVSFGQPTNSPQFVEPSSCISRFCGRMIPASDFITCKKDVDIGHVNHCKLTRSNSYGTAGDGQYFSNNPRYNPLSVNAIPSYGSGATAVSSTVSLALSQIQGQLSTIQTSQGLPPGTLTALLSNITQLQSVVGSNNNGALSVSLSAVQASLTAQTAQFTNVTSSIGVLTGNYTQLQNNLSSVTNNITALGNAFNTLFSAVNASAPEVLNITWQNLASINITRFKDIAEIDLAALEEMMNKFDFEQQDLLAANANIVMPVCLALAALALLLSLVSLGVMISLVAKNKLRQQNGEYMRLDQMPEAM